MKVVAILQARTSSSRLPNKVLLPILGRPMLAQQLARVSRAKLIDEVIVATSYDSSDDGIEALCVELGLPCYRGELDDVLSRFYFASKLIKSDLIVRLTGDCPLTDPSLIDDVIEFHINGGFDYSSNGLNPTFPDGLDVEIFKTKILEQVYSEATLPSEREHVTLYINNHKELFKLGSFEQAIDMSDMRWTVDEKEDFEFVSIVYNNLFHLNENFSTLDILNLLKSNPDILNINDQFERNEGLIKSQNND